MEVAQAPDRRDRRLARAGRAGLIECESYARYDGGNDLILIGKVQALTTTSVSYPRPLVFYRGTYQKIERTQACTPQDLSYLVHGW